jgi:hypothetical protein
MKEGIGGGDDRCVGAPWYHVYKHSSLGLSIREERYPLWWCFTTEKMPNSQNLQA